MSEAEINNDDSTPNSPGLILKHCREDQGMSLNDAADATRIGVDYLTALENDQVDSFPNPAYMRGFLRTYSTHLGLNPDEMLNRYETIIKTTSEQDPEASADIPNKERFYKSKRFSLEKLWLPGLLLLMLLITVSFIRRSQTPPPKTAPAPQQAATPAVAIQAPLSSSKQLQVEPEQAIKEESEKDDTEEETPPRQPPAKPVTDETAKGFIARLKVTHGGTLEVTIDGDIVQEYTLANGDSFEWKATKNISMVFSEGGGGGIEMNGKPYKSVISTDKPVSIKIDNSAARQ